MDEKRFDCSQAMQVLLHQIESLYWITKEDREVIDLNIVETEFRIGKCFSHRKNKYYKNISGVDPLHNCQYTSFLYYLSNTIFREGGLRSTCDKIYGVLKIVSSADMFYEVQLPDIMAFDHPQGSVLGRATYSDYFTFSQGVTVGNNHGVYPHFGKCVALMSDAKVIGDCKIGSNVIVSAGSYIKDTDIPDNSLVFGMSPNLIIKTNEEYVVNHFVNAFNEMEI